MELSKIQTINKINIIKRCIRENIHSIIIITFMILEYKTLMSLSDDDINELAYEIRHIVIKEKLNG